MHPSGVTSAQASGEIAETIDKLKAILAHDLNLKKEDISDTVPLLEDGLALDSVVLIELIDRAETEFDFQLGDENLRSDLFKNLTTLAEFIVRQKAKQN